MATSKPKIGPEQMESFVNDQLRTDLKHYEEQIVKANKDITDFVELQKSIEQMQVLAAQKRPLKTKVSIGCEMMVSARVDDLTHICIDVGLKIYVEFTLSEALKFIAAKLEQLNAVADRYREESVKVRAYIKLAMMTIGEDQGVTTIPEET